LVNMRGRIYDPRARQFTSPDPFMQAPFVSVGLNRYSYVFNNPLRFTDPTGFDSNGDWGEPIVATPDQPASVSFPDDYVTVPKQTTVTAPADANAIQADNPSANTKPDSLERSSAADPLQSTGRSGPAIPSQSIVASPPSSLASGPRGGAGGASASDGAMGMGGYMQPVDDSEARGLVAAIIFGGPIAALAAFQAPAAALYVAAYQPELFWGSVTLGAALNGITSTPAARTGVLEGANFAQKTFGQMFSEEGAFAGQTVQEVADALRSGAMKVSDVPINYIVRDGNTLILNTRSAQALEAAGIPRSAWEAVNRTGQELFESLLSGQLQRNGLTSAGTATVRQSGL
jgi:hypothetical protein